MADLRAVRLLAAGDVLAGPDVPVQDAAVPAAGRQQVAAPRHRADPPAVPRQRAHPVQSNPGLFASTIARLLLQSRWQTLMLCSHVLHILVSSC